MHHHTFCSVMQKKVQFLNRKLYKWSSGYCALCWISDPVLVCVWAKKLVPVGYVQLLLYRKAPEVQPGYVFCLRLEKPTQKSKPESAPSDSAVSFSQEADATLQVTLCSPQSVNPELAEAKIPSQQLTSTKHNALINSGLFKLLSHQTRTALESLHTLLNLHFYVCCWSAEKS